MTYAYDSLGCRSSMTAAGRTVVYAYDRLSRLSTVQQTGETSPATYCYDAAGRRVSLTLPNGVATAYAYNNAGQLADLHSTKPDNSTLARFTYTLDPTGNRTAIQQNLNGTVNNIVYGFDNAYRLTSEVRTDTNNNVLYSEGFEYDAVGNRVIQVKNGTTITRTYNNVNQLTTETDLCHKTAQAETMEPEHKKENESSPAGGIAPQAGAAEDGAGRQSTE